MIIIKNIIADFSGGLTSKLYRCCLSVPPVDREPTDVLFRIHGEVLSTSTDSLLNNTIVTALLAERRLGPKLYAVFPGGRIEEFMHVGFDVCLRVCPNCCLI